MVDKLVKDIKAEDRLVKIEAAVVKLSEERVYKNEENINKLTKENIDIKRSTDIYKKEFHNTINKIEEDINKLTRKIIPKDRLTKIEEMVYKLSKENVDIKNSIEGYGKEFHCFLDI